MWKHGNLDKTNYAEQSFGRISCVSTKKLTKNCLRLYLNDKVKFRRSAYCIMVNISMLKSCILHMEELSVALV